MSLLIAGKPRFAFSPQPFSSSFASSASFAYSAYLASLSASPLAFSTSPPPFASTRVSASVRPPAFAQGSASSFVGRSPLILSFPRYPLLKSAVLKRILACGAGFSSASESVAFIFLLVLLGYIGLNTGVGPIV